MNNDRNENDRTTLVLGDLTALFAARSFYQKSINYAKLDETLKRVLGVEEFDVNIWYTLFRQDNEKQASFIQGLRDLGWDIDTVSTRDVQRMNDPRNYRFDTRIAYNLGLAVEAYDRVVVVTDSFELYPAFMSLHDDDPNIDTYLAFFSDALDGRWWKEIRRDDSRLHLIDLEEELHREED
ncbi:MAG TPA: hypothetical protein VMW91_09125 [Desulfosporosinus sp.]|nr:hypothetical protein [Desulfosporosinus sp.]